MFYIVSYNESSHHSCGRQSGHINPLAVDVRSIGVAKVGQSLTAVMKTDLNVMTANRGITSYLNVAILIASNVKSIGKPKMAPISFALIEANIDSIHGGPVPRSVKCFATSPASRAIRLSKHR